MLPTPPPPSQPTPTPPTPTPTQMPPPPPPRRTGARRRGTSTCPQLWGQERGRQGAGFQKRCWQGLRLIPIKLVCLNLIGHDTGQQPVPAYRPANRANKKAAASCTYQVQQCTYPVQQCTYPVQQCLYISWNVWGELCTQHELHNNQCTRLYTVRTCLYNPKWVRKPINVYIHVWTMYIHVYSSLCTYHVHTMYIRVHTFSEMYVHVCTCSWFFIFVHSMYVSCCR